MLSPPPICWGWENPFLTTLLDSQVSWFLESFALPSGLLGPNQTHVYPQEGLSKPLDLCPQGLDSQDSHQFKYP